MPSPTGIHPVTVQPGYKTYRSPYGPKYKVNVNTHGWNLTNVSRLGMTLGAFGGVAGLFAVFFFSDVPRFRKDVMQHIPLIGGKFIKEVPPSDNDLACLEVKLEDPTVQASGSFNGRFNTDAVT